MKTCVECSQSKQLTEYRLTRNGKTKYNRCKKCYYKAHKAWNKNNPISIMLQSARHRARRDGLPFSLTKADITIPDICPVLGIKLAPGDRHNHDFAPTLDRVRPELGYVQGNVAVISYRANRIKNDATLDELARVMQYAHMQMQSCQQQLANQQAASAQKFSYLEGFGQLVKN